MKKKKFIPHTGFLFIPSAVYIHGVSGCLMLCNSLLPTFTNLLWSNEGLT